SGRRAISRIQAGFVCHESSPTFLPSSPVATGASCCIRDERLIMRALIVEDDRKVAAFIQSGLEQEGWAVDVLHDGRDAGPQVQVVEYDAVVLDLMLPGRSGFQVLRDIKSRRAL